MRGYGNMKVEDLSVTFSANMEGIQMLLNDLEVLRARFPRAVEWLFHKDGRFEGMIEIQTVQTDKPTVGSISMEAQPDYFLLGYVHALKIAYERDFNGGGKFPSFAS
jgi:hypothetical protein